MGFIGLQGLGSKNDIYNFLFDFTQASQTDLSLDSARSQKNWKKPIQSNPFDVAVWDSMLEF